LARLRTIVDTLRVAVQVWNHEGRLDYSNAAAAFLFGDDLTLLSGQPSSRQLTFPDDSSCLGTTSPVWQVLHSGVALTDQVMRLEHASQPERWLRVHAYPLHEAGRLSGVLTSSADVTSLIEKARHLEWLAHNDTLTGLPNRVLLADRLQVAMAHSQRTATPMAVCLLDLDGFKQVNDSHGHKVGDTLLQEVAQRLLAIVRGDDTVARLGGDEFALLLVELKSLSECELVLRRILQDRKSVV
jgi:PAS domain S-box-containing protein